LADLLPKEIVLYVCDNDLGHGISKEEVHESFDQLTSKIWVKYPDITIHYMSIKPSPARNQLIPTIKWVNQRIQEKADRSPNLKFIDIYEGMLDNGHHPNTSYYLSDLLHMNRKGYVVWKALVRKHFNLD